MTDVQAFPLRKDDDTGDDNERRQQQEKKMNDTPKNDLKEAEVTLAEYMEEQEASVDVDDDGPTATTTCSSSGSSSTTTYPSPKSSWERVFCCNSSRYLYCEICCKMLIPTADIVPISELQKQKQRDDDNGDGDGSTTKTTTDDESQSQSIELLPFNVHILIDDRRASSTGIQVRSIFQAIEEQQQQQIQTQVEEKEEEALSSHKKTNCNSSSTNKHTVQIFDIERDEIPTYHNDDAANNNNIDSEETYLLFPGEDSVPLSTILNNNNNNNNNRKQRISTLVVLDCKWARSSSRLHPYVSKLRQVSLDEPPTYSYYWRWHNTGPGMLSTVEAIYYAAWQITTSLGWTIQERKQKLVQLLWLFRLQRNIIRSKYQRGLVKGTNPHVPFTEEAKNFARQKRQQQKKKKGSKTNNRSSSTQKSEESQ